MAQQVNRIEPLRSHPGWERARCASRFRQNEENLIPYSAKDRKSFWTLWDLAQRAQKDHQQGLRYRNIYAMAVGMIVTGCLIQRMGLSFSEFFGGILMIAGALIGAWYSLKSLRHKRQSDPEGPSSIL